MTLRTLNYWNYGLFFIMGNAGSISSTVVFFLSLHVPLYIYIIYIYIHTYIVYALKGFTKWYFGA